MASKSAIATMLKADLVAAQVKVTELLEAVINDGQTRTITGEDGEPAAVMMPWGEYQRMLNLANQARVGRF
jgi:PHD/YefM family antitoxin component YafN of YafNO toxin-antitoxin module